MFASKILLINEEVYKQTLAVVFSRPRLHMALACLLVWRAAWSDCRHLRPEASEALATILEALPGKVRKRISPHLHNPAGDFAASVALWAALVCQDRCASAYCGGSQSG